MDVDFHRSALHKYFCMNNDRGILKWFETPDGPAHDDNLPDHPALGITAIADTTLHLLRSGGSSRDSTELFVDKRFTQLLTALK